MIGKQSLRKETIYKNNLLGREPVFIQIHFFIRYPVFELVNSDTAL